MNSQVTDVGVRALRGLTKLTELNLRFCSHVSNVGLQHLSSLSALTYLNLSYTTTTQAGRDALTAALPATETDGYVKFSVLQAASAATRCSWRRCFAVRERSIPQTCSLCVTLSCRPVAAGREGATLAVGQAKWYTLSFGATEQARLAITSLTQGQGPKERRMLSPAALATTPPVCTMYKGVSQIHCRPDNAHGLNHTSDPTQHRQQQLAGL